MLSQILGIIVLALPVVASLIFAFMPERKEKPVTHRRWRIGFIVAAVAYTAIVFWQQRLAIRDSDRDRENAIRETSDRVSKQVAEQVRDDYQDTIKRQADKIGELQGQLKVMGEQVNTIRTSNIVTGAKPVKVEVTNAAAPQPTPLPVQDLRGSID
jgi:cbb3-type cytochrome oxidase subunit 3